MEKDVNSFGIDLLAEQSFKGLQARFGYAPMLCAKITRTSIADDRRPKELQHVFERVDLEPELHDFIHSLSPVSGRTDRMADGGRANNPASGGR
jgi:hypothetical protein